MIVTVLLVEEYQPHDKECQRIAKVFGSRWGDKST
jgi:hypothetical protein